MEQGLGQSPVPPLRGRGLRSTCTPRQGYHPCTRSAMNNMIEQGCFRMKGEETKNSTTGATKTIKIADGKMNFPSAYFFIFPGCFASGWRRSAAQPVARSAGIQLAKKQSTSAKGFLRGWLCHTQFAKKHSFSAKVCVHVTLFHRDIACNIQIASSGEWVQGQ